MITLPLIPRRRTQPPAERPAGTRTRHRPETMPRLRWY
jgi:hypothetical protein